ncbi:MAG: hypothetical protein QM532_03440 [Cyanobium sp. MAG06]|nr:hypothetical protein [Cyanobium sp. MAG06]
MKSKTNISNTSNDELQFKSINSIKKIILYFSLIIPLLAIVFNKYFTEIAGELGGNLSLYSLFIIVITGPLFILFPNKVSKLFMDIRPELGVFMGIVAITHGFYGVMGLFNYLESLESPIALPPII